MKYLVTGATGFIGGALCKALADEGHEVRALYRNPSRATPLQTVEGVRLFQGDILHPESLRLPMRGCDGVFHVAAYAKPWARHADTYFRFNVQGAKHVFHAARAAAVRRVVFTSTAGVINPSTIPGQPTDEQTPRSVPYFTDYDRSKSEAENLAADMAKAGMEVVTVCPSRVFGPGELSESNGVTRMIRFFLQGRFRTIPGSGRSIGNYVFIDDVVRGHLLAMEAGRNGERYILGGENVSFNAFFDLLSDVSGCRISMVRLPVPLILLAAHGMEAWARLTGTPPLLTPPWVRKYLYHWELSIEKARTELGYRPLPLAEGLDRTIDWVSKVR
ncbi:MAG: hypothetical protein RLY31_1953 [Bacteroidota bacterium]|jgi:farnesol dehydrogenase